MKVAIVIIIVITALFIKDEAKVKRIKRTREFADEVENKIERVRENYLFYGIYLITAIVIFFIYAVEL